MTPQDALDQAITERMARFRYIAGEPGGRLDYWDQPAEVEARGGADCDGLTIWCLWRASQLCPAGCYWFVRGTVQGQGHAWAEIRMAGQARIWADPTGGRHCTTPEWFEAWCPVKGYPWTDGILGPPTDYMEE